MNYRSYSLQKRPPLTHLLIALRTEMNLIYLSFLLTFKVPNCCFGDSCCFCNCINSLNCQKNVQHSSYIRNLSCPYRKLKDNCNLFLSSLLRFSTFILFSWFFFIKIEVSCHGNNRHFETEVNNRIEAFLFKSFTVPKILALNLNRI